MKRSHKKLPGVELISYGRYAGWDKESRELPRLEELTDRVKAIVDVEFGMIVRISKGKGWYLQYRIEHPPFTDEGNKVVPAFTGEYQIRSNPADFFLGDTIWEPVEDKKGIWTLQVLFEGQLMAEKSIELY